MSEIHVWPEDVTVSFEGPAKLLDIATDAGITIAHLCGGKARCSTCRVRILEGLDGLSGRTPAESAMAESLSFPDEVRLACQTEVTGSVKLGRLVLDELDVEMASQLGEGHYVGPVGSEVNAAVMFVDVAGFTTMSEHLPAYDVVHILNRFFTRAGEAVEGLGGHVDNYMGDGLLAVFGVRGEPDPAVCAIKAGQAMLDVADSMTKYINMIYQHPFRIRVGLAYGEVIFGLMGGENSARETVIGDVVNTASRLEAANKTTGTSMLVDEAVKAQAGDAVEYGQQFELDLPGKGGMVTAHEVVQVIDG